MYRLVGADGVTRWVHDRARTRRRPDGTFEVSGIVSDVTERRRLEDELRRSMAEMQRAHEQLEQARAEAEVRASTDELTGAFNRRRFAELANEALVSPDPRCGLLLLDADHFKHINDAYGHTVGDAVLVQLARRLEQSLEPGDFLARWGGEEFAVLLGDVSSEDELADRAEGLRLAVRRTPITHGAARLPLTISIGAAIAGSALSLHALIDRADGCLYAAKRQGRNRVSLDPDAGKAAITEPEVVGLARALAYASSLREGTPEEHAEEVATLAMRTAERLGLAMGVVLCCRLGGWLHDVGKVAVPDQILSKPGPLDDGEWALMRTHPVVGAAIVRRVSALRDAAPAVRHHHERFDGTGYPDRLAGVAIPIEARIVAAADAFAAMTANRVYSPALPPGEAAAELRRSAGTHLDPRVVEALLEVLGLTGEATQQAA
jgi:diguanylate cyclase (GGDEF)-like protein/putative nucleotidyltransferase with HDIG domain